MNLSYTTKISEFIYRIAELGINTPAPTTTRTHRRQLVIRGVSDNELAPHEKCLLVFRSSFSGVLFSHLEFVLCNRVHLPAGTQEPPVYS